MVMMLLSPLMLGMALAAASPQAMELSPGGDIVVQDSGPARARLSLMRADGVEIAWIEGVVRMPVFDETAVLPDVIRFEAPRIDPETGMGQGVGDTVRFELDRSTSLRDGGISGSASELSGEDGLMRLSSLAEGEGEYDIYDLELAWDALSPGPVTVSLTGGLKAIEARIGQVVQEGGVSTFRDARGIAAIPVVGGSIAWRVNDRMTLSGSASTQAMDGQGTVTDMSAETSLRLSPNIGFSAGYQFIQGSMEVQSLRTDLDREGVFARIQIRF